MRALYARRRQRFVELRRDDLSEWMMVSENDCRMQLFGQFVQPFDDREIALSYGVNAQPVSANYHCDAPRHGLLLGYARLNERESLATVSALRQTFERLKPSVPALPAPADAK
jgi:DNA-binding transcriptional MocR family regulator